MSEKKLNSSHKEDVNIKLVGKVVITNQPNNLAAFWILENESKAEYVVKGESVSELLYNVAEHLDSVLVNETRETMKQTIINHTQIKRATFLAQQIGETTSYNWFKLDFLAKKTKNTPQEIAIKIDTLKMFGMINSRQDKNYVRYKVVLDKEARNVMLMEHIKKLKNQIIDTENQLNALAITR